MAKKETTQENVQPQVTPETVGKSYEELYALTVQLQNALKSANAKLSVIANALSI